MDLGTLVSSLYGAPKFTIQGSHGVRIFTISKLSLHRYPKVFQFAFRQKAALLQASALTS